jgi:hypothetical protein
VSTAAALVCAAAPVRPGTWHVTADGAGDAPTLAAAVDSAVTGDTLLVGPGTYFDHGVVTDKGLLVRGTSGAAATVLDGGLSGRILTLIGHRAVTLEGLTFLRGWAGGGETNSTGGAVAAYGTALVVRDCVFRSNQCTSTGGAVFMSFLEAPAAPDPPAPPASPSLLVTGCLFEDNRSGDDGGAVFSEDVAAVFQGTTFRKNRGVAGGAVSLGDGAHGVVGCTFEENAAVNGGGFHVAGEALVTVEGTLFSGNRAENFGGGMRVVSAYEAAVSRSWFLDNTATRGGGLHSLLTPLVADHVLWYGGTAVERGGGVFLDRADGTAFTRCTWLENSAPYGASFSTMGTALEVHACLGGDPDPVAFHCSNGSTLTADCNAGDGKAGGCVPFQARIAVTACLDVPEALCTLPVVSGCGIVGHADTACPEGACPTAVLPTTWGRLKTLYPE